MANRSQRRLAWRQLSQYIPLTDNQSPLPPEADEPTLTQINPNDAPVGCPEFDMQMDGTGFVDGAVGVCNGSDLVTTFISEVQLSAKFSGAGQVEGLVDISVRNPDGWESDPPVQFMFTAAAAPTLPALTSLNPATLPAGTMDWSVGVNGTGFVDGDTVYADDTPLPTSFFGVTYLNATMLASLMTVPTTIAITQRRGAETSPPLTFTVGPPLPVPAITSTSPASVVAGSPNTPLTVTGTGFDDQCQIRLNGSGKSTTFVSDTQLTAVIAASLMTTAGEIAVTVNNPNAGLSNAVAIAVTEPVSAPVPILASIAPTSSPLNPLQDLELVCYCDASLTYHADMWAMIDDVRYEYFSWSQQYLTLKIPKADLTVSGTRQVRVVDASGESLPLPFVVEAAPPLALTIYSPIPIRAGQTGAVTVRGTSFDATTEFYLDGGLFPAEMVTIVNSSTARIVAPTVWVEGDHTMTAYSETLGQNSNVMPVRVAPALIVTSVTPSTAEPGSPDVPIVVIGSGFTDISHITIDGGQVLTTFVSDTQLNHTLVAAWMTTARTLSIAVEEEVSSNSLPFTVAAAAPPAPVLTSVNPNTAVVGAADFDILFNGSGFVSGALAFLAGSALVTTYVGPIQLVGRATGVGQTAGNKPASVRNPDLQESSALTFSFTAPVPPVITLTSPSGLTAGQADTLLTLTGTGFDDTCAIGLNAAYQPTTFISATQLSATIPAAMMAMTGTINIVVNKEGAGDSNVMPIFVSSNEPLGGTRKTGRRKR